MNLRASATRYAKALLDIAIAESDAARIEQDLAAIVSVMDEHSELRHALTSPRIPAAARRGIVGALAERATVAPPLAKLLALLADRGRLGLLPELLVVYRERLLAHQHIVQASVTSPAPLAPETLQRLAERLGALTCKQVQLSAAVDPSLLGGMVARVGSTVYDGSVRTQLAKMKEQFIETA
jgi:F-type H+-transporting ATPase subunit delta